MEKSFAKIGDILDLSELKKLFSYFSVMTGLDVTLYASDGQAVLTNRQKDSVCDFADNCSVCRENIVYGGLKSAELGEPYIFSCGCGLIMCSSPVIFEGKLIGSIVCGPTMLWEADEFAKDEFFTKLSKLNITGDFSEYFNKIKTLDCVNMTAAAQILFIIVNSLSREHGKYLLQRAKISDQQSRISELIAEKKASSVSIERIEKHSEKFRNPLEMEKELISYVQTGNRQEAKKILNSILGEIFSLSGGDTDIIKIRVFELLAFLSRAAVDSGAPLSSTDEIIRKASEIMKENADFEEVCFLTAEALDAFIDVVYESRSLKKSSEHLSKAIAYIAENFADELSLGKVAGAVFVSNYYLSHLFRDEMGTTFSDYLCKVRIEKAKEYLKDVGMKISEAAEKAGFNDANYFAKTFKKYTGLTPKAYRSLF